MLRLHDILMSPVQDESTTGLAEDMALLGGDEAPLVPEVPETPESDDESEIPEEPEVTGEDEIEEQEEPISDDKPIYEKPTIAQLKEKYPDILKTFPALRDVYYREQAYSQLFPTMDDAKVASENDEAFRSIREGVMTGDLNTFFSAVKEASPESLDKIAGNLLPTLNRISPDLHWKASLPVMEGLVQAVYREGSRFGDSEQGNNLRNAALWVAQFIFGEGAADITTGKKSLIPKPEQTSQISEERKQLDRMKGEVAGQFITSTQEGMIDGLKGKILERGQHNKLKIDPDGVMSDFMKTTLTEKIVQEVGKALESDPAHMKYMRSLWAKAREAGYVGDWKSRITNAYLERAKSLVPAIRNRLVAEALGTHSAINHKKLDSIKNGKRVEPGNSGRVPNGASVVHDPKSIDYRKTSDMDILNGKVTLKK